MDNKEITKRIKEYNENISSNEQQLKQIRELAPRLQNNIAFNKGRVAELEDMQKHNGNGKKVK